MYDIIIKNGTVVDGTRKKPYVANILVKDGVIKSISPNTTESAKTVIDAKGLIVSPGFIDIHSHTDGLPFYCDFIRDCKLQQGITTEIGGNCGTGNFPTNKQHLTDMEEYLIAKGKKGTACENVTDFANKVTEVGFANNVGMLVGHGALRISVMGFVNRNPDEKEMQELENSLDNELSRGAFGMSLGLIYPPSAFSEREELVRLSKVIAKHGAILAVHMRNEGPKIFEAVEEMLSIAKESGVHLEISHLKLMGKPQWGRSKELLSLIEKAIDEGVNVTCDQYPFLASSTSLTAVVPHWAHDGGAKELYKRLLAPTEQLKKEMAKNIDDRGGADTIMIVSADGAPQYNTKYLSEIMQENGLCDVDAAIKILVDGNARVSCNYFCINKEDMLNIMPKLYISVGTDGAAYSYDKSKTKNVPHPRNFNTFPQYFQCVRENNLMPIEDAVYKCTGLPAKVLNLKGRGVLTEGAVADITIFNKDTIKNNGNFIESRVLPDGIEYVIINGQVALKDKTVVNAKLGAGVLRTVE